MLRTAFLALALTGLLACGEEAPAPTPAADPPARPAAASASEASSGHSESDGHRHGEQPLPAFSGYTLEGERLSISSLIGKRLVLFFFNPEVKDSRVVAEAVAEVAKQRAKHNFEIVGVALGSTSAKARAFVDEAGLREIRVIDDASGRVAARLGLRQPLYLIGADPEGYLSFGITSFTTGVPGAADVIAGQIRDQLRLPSGAAAAELDAAVRAPDFEAPRLEGGEPFRLSEQAPDRPAVVMFFLHTCPHCHHALQFFKEQLAKIPEDARPLLVGISLQNRTSAVRATLKEMQLDFFPVVLDPGNEVQNAYGVFGGVPDISLVDAQGRIVHRVQGWREERDPSIVRMFLAKIAGQPVPMLLNPRGYTGNDVCGVCHEAEHATWELTSHASAYDTLVTHGSDRDPECVSCHVVGFDEPGGFTIPAKPTHLEDVGCESCHGRGGPHLSPQFVKDGSYEETCLGCHNPTHSLGFEYASFRPKISHAAIAALTTEERKALLASHGKVRDVLPTGADYVGSESCQGCHAAEFATWAASPHAGAVDTLRAKGEAANADCLACHTTAFGRPGGFPKTAAVAAHPDLARVGCESCHGPGGNHVTEDAPKRGSIVSLGDKCDSCVILQICGSCHDDANDPGFEFEVQERIEAQRHGTIEAGTGKPLDSAHLGPHPRIETALARAFELAGEGG